MMFLQLLLATVFTFVEWNCENLFDTRHDSLVQDEEFTPSSVRHWTPWRYWQKLYHVGQTIVSCSDTDAGQLPDMAVLLEVENDSVMHDLTCRTPLRHAGYQYVMTDGKDVRGINVALLYSPFSFRLISHHSIRIHPPKGQRPSRDILYASGEVISGDTLHVFAVHAPSRYSGEKATRPYRMMVAERLAAAVDSVVSACSHPLIVVAGDFNDYSEDASLKILLPHHLGEASLGAEGSHGAKGTYRYQGKWGSLDHVLCNDVLSAMLDTCMVNDAPFLLEEDKKYGGVKPRRTYLGPRYLGGFSDHLPLVVTFLLDQPVN